MSSPHRPAPLALLLLLALAAPITSAQTPAPPHGGPSAAAVPAPAASSLYRPAFEGYRRWADEPVQPWRRSNDAVGRLGGWRAYAREAQQAAPAASAAAQPPQAPAGASHPHHGHGTHPAD